MALHIGTFKLPSAGTESTCLTILQGDHVYCLTSAMCLAPYFNQSEDTPEISKILHDDSLSAELTDVGSLNFRGAQTCQPKSSRAEMLGSKVTSNSDETLKNNLTRCKDLPCQTTRKTPYSEQTLKKNLTSCKNLVSKEEAYKQNAAKRVNLNSVKSDSVNNNNADIAGATLSVRDRVTENKIIHTKHLFDKVNNVNARSDINADCKGRLDTTRADSSDHYFESAPTEDSQLNSAKSPAGRVIQLDNKSVVVKPCFVHQMPEVQQTLRRIFKSQDFKINDRDMSQNELLFELASIVIIFGTSTSKDNLAPLLQTLHSSIAPPTQGAPVVVVSSPFSLPALRYCWSQGILGSVLTPPVFLTDASLTPGPEGSPVFSADGGLVGIVVCSLFRNQSEVISFSLGVSLLPMFQDLGTAASNISRIEPSSSVLARHVPSSSVIARHVVLVRCGASWGSGVILDAEDGIVITCAHVVAANEDIVISYLNDSHLASLVFKTSVDSAFDLALLSTGCELRHGLSTKLNPGQPLLGSGVTCAGYPVFNEHALSPLIATLSSGIVSKLHKLPAPPGGITSKLHRAITSSQRSNTTPPSGDSTKLHPELVMLQSTCTVHSGVSGGGLFDSGGALVGVMVCNVKSSWGDATGIHPCLNMAVPICAIQATLAEYLRTKDTAVLESLNVSTTDVKRIWNLQPLRSKL